MIILSCSFMKDEFADDAIATAISKMSVTIQRTREKADREKADWIPVCAGMTDSEAAWQQVMPVKERIACQDEALSTMCRIVINVLEILRVVPRDAVSQCQQSPECRSVSLYS